MKTNPVVVFVLCGAFCGCDRQSNANSSNTLAATTNNIEVQSHQAQWDNYDKQAKQSEEQLRDNAQMQKRADELLQGQQAMHNRANTLLETQEQLMKRQQDDFTRFEKILDTWEAQQKQYQKYLDSLSK